MAGDFDVKLGADGKPLDDALKKNAASVKELRQELKNLQNQAVGLSRFSEGYRAVAKQAESVRDNLKKSVEVGKTFGDTMTAKLTQMAIGFASVTTAVRAFQNQYENSVKYVKDHPYEFSVDTRRSIREIEKIKDSFDKAFAKSKAFQVFETLGLMIDRPLLALSGRAGGISVAQASAQAESEIPYEEFLRLQADDDKRSKEANERAVRADKEAKDAQEAWIQHMALVQALANEMSQSIVEGQSGNLNVPPPPRVNAPRFQRDMGGDFSGFQFIGPRWQSEELPWIQKSREQMFDIASGFTDRMTMGLMVSGQTFGKLLEMEGKMFLAQLTAGLFKSGLAALFNVGSGGGGIAGLFGFAGGGDTGRGVMHDPNLPGRMIAGYVHDNEYVVDTMTRYSPQGAMHVAALEQIRRSMSGFARGGFTPTTPIPIIRNNLTATIRLNRRELGRAVHESSLDFSRQHPS